MKDSYPDNDSRYVTVTYTASLAVIKLLPGFLAHRPIVHNNFVFIHVRKKRISMAIPVKQPIEFQFLKLKFTV